MNELEDILVAHRGRRVARTPKRPHQLAPQVVAKSLALLCRITRQGKKLLGLAARPDEAIHPPTSDVARSPVVLQKLGALLQEKAQRLFWCGDALLDPAQDLAVGRATLEHEP